MHPAYYILFGVFGAAFVGAVVVKLRVLMRAKKRVGLTAEQFADDLASRDIPREIGEAVFRGFRKWGCELEDEESDFPLTPQLPVSEFTTFVAYDYEDILIEVLAAVGRHWPEKMFPDYSHWTLEDVARFVAGCPRIHEHAS
jgi:hypothetical protein